MRIFVMSDTVMATPTEGGHGLGRVVSIISEGLLARGHDVILLAKMGSRFSGARVMVDVNGYDGEKIIAKEALKLHKEFPADVFLDCGHIHYISRILPNLPVVNMYNDIYQPYSRCAVLLSAGQQAIMPREFENARIIPNSLNPADYVPGYDITTPSYVLFMGAISELKQPLLAIEACARLGIKLIIAGQPITGKVPITESSNVEYVGVATGSYKDQLYSGARVFLQLGVGESFGITTLEAGLYGTPVVGWPYGGTLGLIRYGANGSLVVMAGSDKVQNVVDAIERAWYIPRQACRAWAETLCDNEKQIDSYEDALSACARGLYW